MKVKIIKSSSTSYWYSKYIGSVFDVEDLSCKDFFCKDETGDILKVDCKIVAEAVAAQAATKIVIHEGVSYEVPAYATCLTRDSVGKSVYHWENTPTWHSPKFGYMEAGGKRGIATVYVPPKPDGHFILAI